MHLDSITNQKNIINNEKLMSIDENEKLNKIIGAHKSLIQNLTLMNETNSKAIQDYKNKEKENIKTIEDLKND